MILVPKGGSVRKPERASRNSGEDRKKEKKGYSEECHKTDPNKIGNICSLWL